MSNLRRLRVSGGIPRDKNMFERLWIQKLTRLGLRRSLLEAMRLEAGKPLRSACPPYQITMCLDKDGINGGYKYRALDEESEQIFDDIGFRTPEGAIGRITEMVAQASEVYPNTRYTLLGENWSAPLQFDSETKRWIPPSR